MFNQTLAAGANGIWRIAEAFGFDEVAQLVDVLARDLAVETQFHEAVRFEPRE